MKQLTIVVLLIFCVQITPALAEVYKDDDMPSSNLIIKTANAINKCNRVVYEIVGKHKISEGLWQVYYLFKTKRGTFPGNHMRLKKLDTDWWTVECGNPQSGYNFRFIQN